jgi:hypothetical protein
MHQGFFGKLNNFIHRNTIKNNTTNIFDLFIPINMIILLIPKSNNWLANKLSNNLIITFFFK